MFYQSTEFKGKNAAKLNKVLVVGASGQKVLLDFLNETSEPMDKDTPIPKTYRRMHKGEFEKLFIESI